MSQLPNYLRSHRKSLALSQDDVAFLLGCRGGSKACRLERFAREPSFEEAVALAIICRKPVEEIFAGTFRRMELLIASRAKTLRYGLERGKNRRHVEKRREALRDLVALKDTRNLSI